MGVSNEMRTISKGPLAALRESPHVAAAVAVVLPRERRPSEDLNPSR